ncbi:MAG: hypothetical protein Q7S66_04110 [bacterium]|nr:hypothetical protein [bacterium]
MRTLSADDLATRRSDLLEYYKEWAEGRLREHEDGDGERLFADDEIVGARWEDDGHLTFPNLHPQEQGWTDAQKVQRSLTFQAISLRIPVIPSDWNGITPIPLQEMPDLGRRNYCPECPHCHRCF